MLPKTFFKLSTYGLHIAVMIAGIHISPEVVTTDLLKALESRQNMIASMFCDCYDSMETRLKRAIDVKHCSDIVEGFFIFDLRVYKPNNSKIALVLTLRWSSHFG